MCVCMSGGKWEQVKHLSRDLVVHTQQKKEQEKCSFARLICFYRCDGFFRKTPNANFS